MVAGNFNHRDVFGALNDADSFSEVETGPTRGPNKLDVFYINFGNMVTESQTLEPLESDGGIFSDHKCVYALADFHLTKCYTWDVKMTRKRIAKADEQFARALAAWDWKELEQALDADCKVEILGEALTDRYFPLVRVCKRSNEDRWIHFGIRKLWKRKLRLYKKEGEVPSLVGFGGQTSTGDR